MSSLFSSGNGRSHRRAPIFLLTGTISLIALIVTLFGFHSTQAAAGLTVKIDTAYNLVVDSNATSPSTYAPRAATVYGTFCNDGADPLTDVYGYIGSYNSGVNSTPGIYPALDTDVVGFAATYPNWAYLAGTGSYAFTHIGGAIGTADATRYIGDLAAGECKVQYWHFTYPACANDGSGNPVEPPCTTIPTWGSSVKAEDDLALSFDIWATGQDGGSTLTDNNHWTMTMRNEISAMANKIKPNPDGNWFNTDTSSIVPGQVITTNGVLYTLGNIRQGFDNDGNYSPDYNAWLQPFGDPSYDPSCFRLIRTSTVLTVSRGAGQPDLILHVNDLNSDPVYGGPLYFTNLPPDNNGVRGEVRYTFLALTGPCSIPITPYQEVASGSDNEKFNGDYGAGIPTVQSSAPEVTINKSGSPDSVAEGADVTYSIPFVNTSTEYSAGLTLNSGGVNMPLVIRDEVPEGMLYLNGTAASGNTNPTDCTSDCFTIRYSADGGATWSFTDPGDSLSAAPNTVIIEWWLNNPVPTSGSGIVTFQARVPGTYLTNGGDPFIENEACANFGGGTDFACAPDITMVLGNNSVGDFVWADLDTDGIQDGGSELGIPDITVSLYWDANGNGLLDDGDKFIATTSTDGNGNYSFTQLPDGNYLVIVDSEDAQLPTGYTNTTPETIAVPLDPTGADTNPVDVDTADFGFGPVLSLVKTLTSANPAYEGETVTFDLTLTNNLPSGPSDDAGYCIYEYWADSATTSTNGQRLFTNPNNILGAPDALYASAASATGNRRWLYGQYTISNLGFNIQKVEALYEVGTGAPLSGDVNLFITRDPNVTIPDNNPLSNIPVTDQYPLIAGSLPTNLTLYDNWEISGLDWDHTGDPNFKFGIVLDGQSGGPLNVGSLGFVSPPTSCVVAPAASLTPCR
ncbi:MAG: SdrD B-like domain-containing protein [Chloroflexota bacterium]